MKEAIERNKDAGILFIAAAGNSGSNNDKRAHYPSSYELDNVLAVAATDNKDYLASFSCYGEEGVDLGAPGVKILSSTPDQNYRHLSGTSMATPHVSGVAALVLSTYPDSDYSYIKDRILKGTDPVETLKGKVATGGRLNAYNAIERDFVAPSKVDGLRIVTAGMSSVQIAWDPVGDDGLDGEAKGYRVTISDKAGQTIRTQVITSTSATVYTLENLPLNFEGSMSVLAVDNVGNEGEPSDLMDFATIKVEVIAENSADNMDGMITDGTWGNLEVDGRTVITDSPEGLYSRDKNTNVEFPAFVVPNGNLAVSFALKYDIEKKYDFGYFEVSEDGEAWSTVQTYTGKLLEWETQNLNLDTFLSDEVSSLHVRFRLKSDRSVEKDGIFIDDFKIYAPRTEEF